jgi:hypothetical protein
LISAVFYRSHLTPTIQVAQYTSQIQNVRSFNMPVTNPRPLGERELALIDLYANCKLELSPQRFYSKWGVSYEQIGYICSRSPTTVRRWFARGCSYRAPSSCDLHHLALMDFLLNHYEEIPTFLLGLLCPVKREKSNQDDT